MPLKFTLSKQNPVVKWPVSIPVPCDDGNVKPHRIYLDFQVASSSEVLERLGALAVDQESDQRAKEYLADKTRGWHDVYDEEGEPLAYSVEAFAQLLDLPYAGMAIQAAYLDCIRGRKAKN